jgi:hypothetical protein
MVAALAQGIARCDGVMVGDVWLATGAPLTGRARDYRREETRIELFGAFPIGAALDHEVQVRASASL